MFFTLLLVTVIAANANGNANFHGKDDVAIARTIVMVERCLNDCRKTKPKELM